MPELWNSADAADEVTAGFVAAQVITESPTWRSGPWSLELRGAELAELSWHGRSVLRGVRAVVRDDEWRSGEWLVGPVTTSDDGTLLTVALRSRGLDTELSGTIRAQDRGTALVIEVDVAPIGELDTNRTGLVVLHPPRLAGHPLEITHPGGTRETAQFPATIAPHQPATDITALAWDDGGLRVQVEFTGDVFEMEDQRNWTDASFKTYNRPLALPFPYHLTAGQRVRQSVTLRVTGAPTAATSVAPERIELTPGGPFPAVGVAASTAPGPEPAGLTPIGQVLLVELDLATPNWPAALARAAARGLPLDVRVVLPTPPDDRLLADLADRLRTLAVTRVAIFDPTTHVSEAALVTVLRAALDTAGVTAAIVGGSRAHFTELNRHRSLLPPDLDGFGVALTPLFHEFGGEQLIESVAMQRLVAVQTVSYANGTPVHVGPVTLRPRFNDTARNRQPGPRRIDLAEGYGAEFTGAVDPRQQEPELAAWTFASAAALAVPGVASLTYFEEWGPRGVHTVSGVPFPVAGALGELAAVRDSTLLHGASPDGLIWALGARRAEHDLVFAANLDTRERTIIVSVDQADHRMEIPPSSRQTLLITPHATPGPPTARG